VNTALVIEDRTPILIVACLLALALRPVGWTASAVTLAAGAVGALAAVEATRSSKRLEWCTVTAVGFVAFALVRAHSTTPSLRATALGIAASVVAAIAEELFFRRLLYSRLVRWGASTAIVGAAALFAIVHVASYGVAAMPVDFAAGLLLGWQRWATGTWTAPAATHVFANLVAVR
jgi:membrane protease YdiL (CAAX protease family)